MSRLRAALLVFIVCCSPLSAWAKGDGEEVYDDMVKQKMLVDDPKLVAYVRAVGQRVAAHTGRSGLDLHFNVIEDDSYNAMTFEDGYIFVHRGLLLYLNSEDQLAGVLGHEIGHYVLGHIPEMRQKHVLNEIGAYAAGLLTFNSDVMDVVRSYGAESMTRYGRDQELQADHAGAEYMAAAGYDPQAMVDLMRDMKNHSLYSTKVKGQSGAYHALQNDHPQDDVRLQESVLNVEGKTAESVQPVDDYLSRIEGIVWGNNGAEGVTRGQSYYHGRLGFVLQAPDGWQISDSASKIMIYMPGGALKGFVSMEMSAADQGVSAEDAARKLMKTAVLTNGTKFDIKDGENKFAAFTATISAPAGTTGTSEIGVVLKDGRAHVFRAETREADVVDGLRKGMRFIMEHLRTMTFADLKVANTERIVLYTVQPGDTYESLAHGTPIPSNAANELRLLNGDYPNGQPRAGDRIKLVH